MKDFINRIIQGDCLKIMAEMPNKCVDLVITSPPYDNLRDYEGYDFNFKGVANQLYRLIKKGGVIVWIVGDATIDGSETGSSFRQALYFKEIGFNLHDTMIWNKGGFSAVGSLAVRYAPVFEYMFVLSKGKPKTFNPIKDRKTKHGGNSTSGTIRQKDGSTKPMSKIMIINDYSQRFNIWEQPPQRQKGDCHPAPFPEQLAKDHIKSWSNEGDLVLDPMCGSGTTCKMARLLNRQFVGIDISEKYCEISRKRLEAVTLQTKLFLE